MDIKRFSFDISGCEGIKLVDKGSDWPVVYMIHNDEELYIGETTSAYVRIGQHLADHKKDHLEYVEIICDDTFNKSVILDYEQKLIKYCKADGKFKRILNRNAGQSSQHNYYQRELYAEKFKVLWNELFSNELVQSSMDIIENKNIFKYSPYNALTEEQNSISSAILYDILQKLRDDKAGISIVNGCAGTGKTVLAVSMISTLANIKYFSAEEAEDEIDIAKVQTLLGIKEYVQQNGELSIGLVFPMSGIRKTIGVVFRDFGNGLSADMVLNPYQLKNKKYDVLFVDESHRLMRRKNLGTNFRHFDDVCKFFSLDPMTANQLEWALIQSRYCVLFYDKDQSIKSTDLTQKEYESTIIKYSHDREVKTFTLTSQIRCDGGNFYIDYVKDILNCRANHYKEIQDYDFWLFDDVGKMVSEIRKLDNEIELCKTVAGFSWEWKTKPNGKTPADDCKYYDNLIKKGAYDIDIKGEKFIWNLVTDGWIGRLDSHYTIGCIHTTQGFDMNVVGVIFGKEIDYDPVNNKIIVDLTKFFDRNVKSGCDEATVKRYIINTYATMMTRGIKGCYVYACNKNMQEYLRRFIKNEKDRQS